MKKLYVFLTASIISATALTYEVPTKKANKTFEKLKAHVTYDNKLAAKNTDDVNVSRGICSLDEEQYLQIEAQVLAEIKNFYASKGANQKDLAKIFTNNFTATNIPFNKGKVLESFEEEEIKVYDLSKSDSKLNQKQFFTEQFKFLSPISDVDYISLDTIKVISPQGSRAADHVRMNSAELLVKFDLRYQLNNKTKINDRGLMNISVVRKGDEWKIKSIELNKGTSLVATLNNKFEEVTQTAINNQVPSHLRREAIRRGGYATAIGDYNNDGYSDMLVATAGEVVLLKGNKDGAFTADEQAGIQKHTFVKSAAFVDLTNSGQQDLVLVRFSFEEPSRALNKMSDIVIYRNNNGKFAKVESPIMYKNEHPYAMPMALADFNHDGMMDLYVGFPGARDFTTMKEVDLVTLKEKNSHGFFYNTGNPKKMYIEQDANQIWHESNPKDEAAGANFFYPHSALAIDFNLDGFMDIVTVDDRNQISPIYQGTENGKFIKSNNAINVVTADYGMGVAFGDVFNRGKLDFLMSSVNFSPNQRINNSCLENWNEFEPYKSGVQGLRFYKNEDKYYTEISKGLGLDDVGYGLSGVELVDYNNDGYLDIVVSNGLWSGLKDSPSTDITSLISRSSRLGLFETDVKDDKFVTRINAPTGKTKGSDMDGGGSWFKQGNKSQSAVMDVLSFAKNRAGESYSYEGFQRKRIFRNNGNSTFTEVGYALGLDSEADGYMVAYADLNRDGRLDIIYRNADPAVKTTQFQPLQIFMNKMKNANSVELKLVGNGRSTNRDAIGALARADIGSSRVVRQLTAMNGTVQSERVIHFGLGSNEYLNNIEITWPDGSKQKIGKLKKGIYQIIQDSDVKNLAKK
ncbi:MAG: CRTAC1 family protein [Pseudobdellovibrio sp.]